MKQSSDIKNQKVDMERGSQKKEHTYIEEKQLKSIPHCRYQKIAVFNGDSTHNNNNRIKEEAKQLE